MIYTGWPMLRSFMRNWCQNHNITNDRSVRLEHLNDFAPIQQKSQLSPIRRPNTHRSAEHAAPSFNWEQSNGAHKRVKQTDDTRICMICAHFVIYSHWGHRFRARTCTAPNAAQIDIKEHSARFSYSILSSQQQKLSNFIMWTTTMLTSVNEHVVLFDSVS